MKVKISNLVAGLVLLAIATGFGYFIGERSVHKRTNAHLFFITEQILLDESTDVFRLKSIFNTYQKSKEEGDEFLKRVIAISYESDTRIRGLFGEDYGQNHQIFMTNQVVTDFLMENPVVECLDVSDEDLLQCNLDNIFPEQPSMKTTPKVTIELINEQN